MKVAITFNIDSDELPSFSDQHLASLWHIAQANPVPISDRDAGAIAEHIGREIIKRWLMAAPPQLWRHQGEHYYWYELANNGYLPANGGPWTYEPTKAPGVAP